MREGKKGCPTPLGRDAKKLSPGPKKNQSVSLPRIFRDDGAVRFNQTHNRGLGKLPRFTFFRRRQRGEVLVFPAISCMANPILQLPGASSTHRLNWAELAMQRTRRWQMVTRERGSSRRLASP